MNFEKIFATGLLRAHLSRYISSIETKNMSTTNDEIDFVQKRLYIE